MKTNKPPNPKINKAKQNERRSAHKRTWESILCWPNTPEHEDYPGCVVEIHNGTPLDETVSSFSQHVSITNNFLDWGEILCLLPFSVLESPPTKFFCVLSQSVSSYVINHIVSGRSFLWCYPTPLDLRIFPLSDLHRSLSVDWRGLM